jgi:hypothetical protein
LKISPLKRSCVAVALIENYSTSKPLIISPEKSQISSFDPVVANERYVVKDTLGLQSDLHKFNAIYKE